MIRNFLNTRCILLVIIFLISCARNTGVTLVGGGSEIPNTLETTLLLSSNSKPENTSMVLQKVSALDSESNWLPSETIQFDKKGRVNTTLDKDSSVYIVNISEKTNDLLSGFSFMPIFSENFTQLDSIKLGKPFVIFGKVNIPKNLQSNLQRVWVPGQNKFSSLNNDGEFILLDIFPGQNTLIIQLGNVLNTLTFTLPDKFENNFNELHFPLIQWIQNSQQEIIDFKIYSESELSIFQTHPILEGLNELIFDPELSEFESINSKQIKYHLYASRKEKIDFENFKDSIQSKQQIENRLAVILQKNSEWYAIDEEGEDYELSEISSDLIEQSSFEEGDFILLSIINEENVIDYQWIKDGNLSTDVNLEDWDAICFEADEPIICPDVEL